MAFNSQIYIAFSKHSLLKLNEVLISKDFDIETEIVIKAEKLGLNVVEVPSVEYVRAHGTSKLNWMRDGFKILKIIIKELF